MRNILSNIILAPGLSALPLPGNISINQIEVYKFKWENK